jgi:hypothetical protein
VCTCQPVLHIQFYLVGGKVGLMLGWQNLFILCGK